MSAKDAQRDYARLGELTFRVQEGVKGFSEAASYDAVGHAVISGKNPLQGMGEKLRQIRMTIDLQGYLADVDPPKTLKALSEMMASGRAQRLFFGDGRYAGNYLVTQMDTLVRRTHLDGAIAEAEVNMTLLEAVDRQVVSYATAEKKPADRRRPRLKPHPGPPPPPRPQSTEVEIVRMRDYLKLSPQEQASSILQIN